MKWIWPACVAGLLVSCGVVGPPIPPENVGAALTIEQQKKRDEAEAKRAAEAVSASEATDTDPARLGQDENLPPLHPVGTR